MWEKEFYLQIMSDDGRKDAVKYFFDELLELKNKTERYIDEFVKIYLKTDTEG